MKGRLEGLYYESKCIPEEWIKGVRKIEYVVEVCGRCDAEKTVDSELCAV